MTVFQVAHAEGDGYLVYFLHFSTQGFYISTVYHFSESSKSWISLMQNDTKIEDNTM